MGQSFKELVVWQRAVDLTADVYKLTAKFPQSECFGLTNQMRRASVSIASNIAEGYGRSTKGEYMQFLGHARGSCWELETQIVISKRLGLGTLPNLESTESLCNDVGRLLGALIKSIRSKQLSVPQPLSPSAPQSLSPSVP